MQWELELHQDFLQISKFLPPFSETCVHILMGKTAFPGAALYYGGAYLVFFEFKVHLICQVDGNYYSKPIICPG